jgi:hypothetical protein
LKIFLGEKQFFGIKKLKINFFDRESKYFPTFSTQLTCQWKRFIMQKKILNFFNYPSLQESLVIFANMPKKAILEKSKKKKYLPRLDFYFFL